MNKNFWMFIGSDNTYGIPETDEINFSAMRKTILNVEFTSKKFKDIEWTQCNQCLIKENVAKLMEQEKFTGYILKPIKSKMRVRDYKIDYDMEDIENPGIHPIQEIGIKIPVYYELAVNGWGGLVNPESGIKRIPATDEWQEDHFVWERAIDEKQWDGSDFFFIWPYTAFKIITNRVAEFFRAYKFSGSQIIKPIDYDKKNNFFYDRRINSGRLREYLDDERAHKYGDPYDIY